MIGAKEIRIGNWLKRLDDSLFQVLSYDFKIIEDINPLLGPNPIPINEETLKLNEEFWEFVGFGTRIIYQHKDFKAIKIEYSNDNDCFFYFNDNLINLKKFVHEAQNLFHSLTSKELELK